MSDSLFIAVATARDPKWSFVHSLVELLPMTRTFAGAQFREERYANIPQARTALVNAALDGGFSHILFLDDDMMFPYYTADKLHTARKPIIAANYTTRHIPVEPLATRGDEIVRSRGRSGIERVDFAPTGIMLIETQVFAKLSKPWFDTPYLAPKFERQMSDDKFFCAKAREAGVEIWVDHDISQECGHIGEHPFNHTMTEEGEPADTIMLARELLGDAA